MSLYNMLHGIEPSAGIVVALLRINDPNAIPRFRDAYLTYRDDTNTDPVMVILTRTGGANRKAYVEGNAMLRALPGFIDDRDDEFDKTFALFRYEVPGEVREGLLRFLAENGRPLTLREKTEQAAGPDQTRRQAEAIEMVSKRINAAVADSGSETIVMRDGD